MAKEDDFRMFLQLMSKKGVFEIFKYIKKHNVIHYNDIVDYAMDNSIVNTKYSVIIILNGLTNMRLLESNATHEHPIQTQYNITKYGEKIFSNLLELQKKI